MPPKLKSPLKRTRCAGQGSLQHFANNVCVLLVEIWRCPWQLSSESFDSGAPITGSHCNRSASFCDLVFSNQGPPNNLSNPSSPNLTLRAPPSSTPPISGRQARYPGMIAVTAPRHNCQCVRYAYVVGSTYSSHFPETSGAYRTTIHRLRGLRYDQAFVTEFDPARTSLVYSMYLGGRGIQLRGPRSYYRGDGACGIVMPTETPTSLEKLARSISPSAPVPSSPPIRQEQSGR
jgi:hypothetical protein